MCARDLIPSVPSYQTVRVSPLWMPSTALEGQRHALRADRFETGEVGTVGRHRFDQHVRADHVDARRGSSSKAAARTKPSSAAFTDVALTPSRMGWALTMPLVSVIEPPALR